MNLPNKLTVFRMILIVPFVILDMPDGVGSMQRLAVSKHIRTILHWLFSSLQVLQICWMARLPESTIL